MPRQIMAGVERSHHAEHKVYIKRVEKMDQDLICYCFNYTAADIKKDFDENDQSTIMARIMGAKKNGKCNCSSTNPKGS